MMKRYPPLKQTLRSTLLRLMLRGEKYTNRTPAASTSSMRDTMSRLGGTKDAAMPRKTLNTLSLVRKRG